MHIFHHIVANSKIILFFSGISHGELPHSGGLDLRLSTGLSGEIKLDDVRLTAKLNLNIT